MRKQVSRSPAVFALVVMGLLTTFRPARAASWQLTVGPSESELGETPVVVALEGPMPVGSYLVTPSSGGTAFAAQVFEDTGGCHLVTVLPHVDRDHTTSYALAGPSSDDSTVPAGLSFETHRRNLKVMLDRHLLTEYHVGVGNKPFFFPLIGPTGESYTRTFPLANVPDEDHDHPHQRSCWFTHGNVNGVDFWSESKAAGAIEETGRKHVVSGPVMARLSTTDDWRAPDHRRVCADERTITFYSTKTVRIIDFAFRIIATDGPVTFHDTKEGMFGLRVASSMDATKKRGGKITNAEGATDDKGWGKASPWVDYVGSVKDRLGGITIINHPKSFRYPTTWHVRTYGLFAANPFGWHDFGRAERGDHTIASGQAIEFYYRVVLHAGDTAKANVPALAAAYRKPPVVRVVKE